MRATVRGRISIISHAPGFLHRVSFANGGLEMKAMIAVLCGLLVVGTVAASADQTKSEATKQRKASSTVCDQSAY